VSRIEKKILINLRNKINGWFIAITYYFKVVEYIQKKTKNIKKTRDFAHHIV
jgi:hypothetical protein